MRHQPRTIIDLMRTGSEARTAPRRARLWGTDHGVGVFGVDVRNRIPSGHAYGFFYVHVRDARTTLDNAPSRVHDRGARAMGNANCASESNTSRPS